MANRNLSVAMAGALALCLSVSGVSAQTDVKMITFGGASSLPVWIAQDMGLFEKNGLRISRDTTRSSQAQIKDMVEGKYQFATTAFDNLVAYHSGTGAVKYDGFDVVALLGVHGGMNSVVASPDIKKWSDIKGRAVSVDAVRSGYATVLYQILKKHGVGEKDYKIIPVGGTGARVKSLKEKTAQMAIISSPEDLRLKREGFNILADAADEMGQYQGSTYAVRRAYAKSNPRETLGFVRAIIAAHDVIHNEPDKAMAVLKKHVKGMSNEDLEGMFQRMRGSSGFFKQAQLSKQGMENVFKLRAVYSGEKPTTDFSKYIDTSFAEQALRK
jgi:ABC-type nitrate/sulfonate/bicarbonate transport system substrate-binding protein